MDAQSLNNCRTAQARENTVVAPAKLNLGLRIVGRRADGYHLLESLFWPISFGDRLDFSTAKEDALTLTWEPGAPFPAENVPVDGSNLVLRALRHGSPRQERFHVHLRKQIPVGAGLGGGSSDAGAVFRFLGGRAANSDYPRSEIANALGADIPFFLDCRPAWVTGIGEGCTPLAGLSIAPSDLYFLLLVAPVAIDTKQVFGAFRKTRPVLPSEAQYRTPPRIVNFASLADYLKTAENELEPVVAQAYPLVGKMLEALRQTTSVYAGLSGSGSTCFALFDSWKTREEATKALEEFCRLNYCRSVKAEGFDETLL